MSKTKAMFQSQTFRYIVNGLVATGIHFSVLSFLVDVVKVPSAGVSNAVGACFGIMASFVGNRYFVFPLARQQHHVIKQGLRFAGAYGLIALVHGAVLTVWADMLKWDYRLGFCLAIGIQVVLGYWINKHFVFATAGAGTEEPAMGTNGASRTS